MAFYKLVQSYWFKTKQPSDAIYWFKEYVLKSPKQRENERKKSRLALLQIACLNSQFGLNSTYL